MEHATWVVDTRKAMKLEAKPDRDGEGHAQLQSIHQKELERKEALCEAEKDRGGEGTVEGLQRP